MRWKYPNAPNKKWVRPNFDEKPKTDNSGTGLNNYYSTEKVLYDGKKIDSKLERSFYMSLENMVKMKAIKSFKHQVQFELIPSTKLEGMKRANRVTYYNADFVVETLDGKELVIDSKGYSTDVFKLKKKIFENKYQRRLHVLKNLKELNKLIMDGE